MSKESSTTAQTRDASCVMNLGRMGAMQQSRISFTRSLVRKMARENWQISKSLWDLCKEGYGKAIYKIQTPNGIYNLVIFSRHIKDDERTDRVIANKWDVTFTLIKGEVSEDLLERLDANVPLQEAGRNCNKALVLARANKSVRIFSHLVDSLASGKQPDELELKKVGYILRTTAVYGSGKFGINDFDNTKNYKDFAQSFEAEMCAVYILREFSIDLVNFLAKNKGGKKSVRLAKNLARYLGVGNATGLGMAPYMIKHSKLIDTWMYQRELAIAKASSKKITDKKAYEILSFLKRAQKHLEDLIIIDKQQDSLNKKANKELDEIIQKIKAVMGQNYKWKDLMSFTEKYSYDAQEILLACILELYPSLVDEFENHMNVSEKPLELSSVKICELKTLLERKYYWALNIDFSKKENSCHFWYSSAEKGEPRLGVRGVDEGAELEMPLGIARAASSLYDKIKDEPSEEFASKFLLKNPSYSSILRRVWTLGACHMGDIQANLLGDDFFALDLLRAKLAIFGATKFDPRSDKWVQATFFQSAPLLDEITEDEWLFPILEKNILDDKSKIVVSKNELRSLCMQSFSALQLDRGEADIISHMVIDSQMVGLNGFKHYLHALKNLKNNKSQEICIKENGPKLNINLNEGSVLLYIQLITAYALDYMQNYSNITIEIKACHNQHLVYRQLRRLAKKGLSAKFSFYDSCTKEFVEYTINKNEEFPHVHFNKDGKDKAGDTLKIEISKDDFKKDCLAYDLCIPAKELEQNLKHTIRDGVLVDTKMWEEVKEISSSIFVKPSKNSRENAGGIVEK